MNMGKHDKKGNDSMTFDPHTDEIAARVTYAVAYDLLAQAGFTKDERGRWAHEDGRWTWQADEAFAWALVDNRARLGPRRDGKVDQTHHRLRTRRAENRTCRTTWAGGGCLGAAPNCARKSITPTVGEASGPWASLRARRLTMTVKSR
jgi:hypothetical protein